MPVFNGRAYIDVNGREVRWARTTSDFSDFSLPIMLLRFRFAQPFSFGGVVPYTLECWIYASISDECQVGFSKINRGIVRRCNENATCC
jgi:hypothetical protein